MLSPTNRNKNLVVLLISMILAIFKICPSVRVYLFTRHVHHDHFLAHSGVKIYSCSVQFRQALPRVPEFGYPFISHSGLPQEGMIRKIDKWKMSV